MTDNTKVADNSAGAGDPIRTKDRAGIKTPITQIDVQDGAGGEAIINGAFPIRGQDLQTLAQSLVATSTANAVTLGSLVGLSSAAVQITGTWTGTVQIQGTVDGTNWFALTAVPTPAAAPVSNITANGQWQVDIAGMSSVRVQVTVAGTGTATVSIRATVGTAVVALEGPLPAGAATIGAVTVSGGTADGDTGAGLSFIQAVGIWGSGSGGPFLIPGSVANGLGVDVTRVAQKPFALALTSAGLTTGTTAYVTGDMLGTIWSAAMPASFPSGGTGLITGVTFTSKTTTIGGVDIYVFNASVSQAADNAANSWSDADMLKLEAVIPVPAPIVSALNATVSVPVQVPFQLAATTIYLCVVTRTGHTFFGAVGDLQIKLRGYVD